MDARVNTADDSTTSDKNLVNFGTVPLNFVSAFTPGGLHAGIFHAFLVSLCGIAMPPAGLCFADVTVFFNVAPLIRQRVDGSQRGLLR